jgi:hypothetical protein
LVVYKKEVLELSQLATEVLLLSEMAYLRGKTFSGMAAVRLKYCNCLLLEIDLEFVILMIQLRMCHTVSNMRVQPSH